MDFHLQNELYEKYPVFFSNKDKSRRESCMAFGIECNNGWYNIISNLCWMINQHENNINLRTKFKQKEDASYQSDYSSFKFDQIKEKFGGLRIYFSGGDDYIRGLVNMAEAISYNTCEICGNKGQANKNGWITVLCDAHRNS